MDDFRGKRVWIIGASEGIGAALAKAFADEGAKLILSARTESTLATLAAECGGAQILPVDLDKEGDLGRAVSILSATEKLDAVVCTAALYDPSRIADLHPESASAMLRVNILGTLNIARLCPPLLNDRGQLVLFGSVAGYFGLPGGQPYSATKAAVNNIAESLAIELAPRVDVRLVCPGFVRSRLTDKNDFDMPAIISAEDAAKRTLKGLKGKSFEIHFPRRFTFAVKLMRLLPYWASLRLTSRVG